MRTMPFYEKKKRGCLYCTDAIVTKSEQERICKVECPHDECPYHVLDKYKSYKEFLASKDSKILVGQFFTSQASVFEAAYISKPTHHGQRIAGDGDLKEDY